MMKKKLSMLLATSLLLGMFASCSTESSTETNTDSPSTDTSTNTSQTTTPTGDTTELYVITSYGGTDGNRANYEKAYRDYETATGNKVLDGSGTSDEAWKAEIAVAFETGTEPDVLFYFLGADANQMIQDGKVVSLAEIREVYPDYASNMIDDNMPASPYDNQVYAVPVNGYWEGLFVNKTVLEDSGVAIPSDDYTWEQFLADCETIKNAGYTPIATSLAYVPHYWFEFTVLNNGTLGNHLDLPQNAGDTVTAKWETGLNDIKELYDLGYLPRNTLTALDDETVQMMADDEAAFLIDGSWKLGWFKDNADVDNYTVTYVPAKGQREATDMIGGISMGYYITRQAWEDEEKQKAAVDFVSAMTTDAVVSNFGYTAVTALKNEPVLPSNITQLEQDAIDMIRHPDANFVGAVQDGIDSEQRAALFASVKEVMTGDKTANEIIWESLS